MLFGLLVAVLASVIFTQSWSNTAARGRVAGSATGRNSTAIDTRPLDVAQQLDQLAETRTEKTYASEALRLGDYSVDFAFAAAIRQAASTPPPTDTLTRAIVARLKAANDAIAADSSRIAALTLQLGKATAASRDDLQQQIDLAQAQLELDRDDVEDAHQDMIRAGGDRLASIERLRAQHDSSQHHAIATVPTGATPGTAVAPVSIELTKSSSMLDQAEAWWSLHGKRGTLASARQAALDRAAQLGRAHDTLEKQVATEKARQQIVHAKGRNASNVALARSAADTSKQSRPVSDTPGHRAPDSLAPSTALSFLQELAVDQKDLSELDKRVENEEDLATLYGNWSSYVRLRQERFVHGMLVTGFWIVLVALIVVGANEAVQRVFSDAAKQRRLHTVRTLMLFAVQAGAS